MNNQSNSDKFSCAFKGWVVEIQLNLELFGVNVGLCVGLQVLFWHQKLLCDSIIQQQLYIFGTTIKHALSDLHMLCNLSFNYSVVRICYGRFLHSGVASPVYWLSISNLNLSEPIKFVLIISSKT